MNISMDLDFECGLSFDLTNEKEGVEALPTKIIYIMS